MTHIELIKTLRAEFVFLHRLVNKTSIKREGKRTAIRDCIREEAIASIALIDAELKQTHELRLVRLIDRDWLIVTDGGYLGSELIATFQSKAQADTFNLAFDAAIERASKHG